MHTKPQVPTEKSVTEEFWDQFAEKYAHFYETHASDNCKLYLDQVFSLSPNKNHLKILDVGCGSGIFSHFLLNSSKKDIESIFLIDFSQKMVDLCAKRFSEEQHKKLKIAKGNVEELRKFTTEEYDLAFGLQIVHLLPEPERMLKDVHHLLKKGAIGFFSLNGIEKANTVFTCFSPIFEKFSQSKPKSTSKIKELENEETGRKIFESAEFEVISVAKRQIEFEPNEELVEAICAALLAKNELKALSPEKKKEFKQEVREEVEKFRAEGKKFAMVYTNYVVRK